MIDGFPPELQDAVMAYAEATYKIAYEDGVTDTLAQVDALHPPVLLEPLPVLDKLEDYQQEFLDDLWESFEQGRTPGSEPPHEGSEPFVPSGALELWWNSGMPESLRIAAAYDAAARDNEKAGMHEAALQATKRSRELMGEHTPTAAALPPLPPLPPSTRGRTSKLGSWGERFAQALLLPPSVSDVRGEAPPEYEDDERAGMEADE